MAVVKQYFGQLALIKDSDVFFSLEDNYLNFLSSAKTKLFFLRKDSLKSFLNLYLRSFNTFGYFVELIFIGVGFKFDKYGDSILSLTAGYSHYIYIPIASDLFTKIYRNYLLIFGYSKSSVSFFSGHVKSFKVPDFYKGKGIRFFDDRILIRIGKRKK